MRTKYALSWAHSVVNQALDKHARVRELFLNLTGLSVEQLALLLACDRPEWSILRDMLKQLDKWQVQQVEICHQRPLESTSWMLSSLIRVNKIRLPEKMLKYLEIRENEARIKEQEKGGGPP